MGFDNANGALGLQMGLCPKRNGKVVWVIVDE
jgi:hypothetical protein